MSKVRRLAKALLLPLFLIFVLAVDPKALVQTNFTNWEDYDQPLALSSTSKAWLRAKGVYWPNKAAVMPSDPPFPFLR